MTETTEKTYSKDEVDEIVKSRVAREREKLQKESGLEDLQHQLEQKDAEIARLRDEAEEQVRQVRQEWLNEKRQAAVEQALMEAGHTDRTKNERILRNLDLEEIGADEQGEPRRADVVVALTKVEKDLPELFSTGRQAKYAAMGGEGEAPENLQTFKVGAGSGGSASPVYNPEKPLTREQIEAMPPEQQNRPGMKEKIDAFLRGER